MSFIRSEARQGLWRWRETLVGLAIGSVGAWWAIGLDGILSWVGLIVGPAGLIFTLAGIQRARFRSNNDGPGLVQVDEGRVTYFGPLSGGVIDLAEMTELTLDPTGKPPHWRLVQSGQPPLFIPVTASGSELLFDAFATLPGLSTERMLAARTKRFTVPQIIWQRPFKRVH